MKSFSLFVFLGLLSVNAFANSCYDSVAAEIRIRLEDYNMELVSLTPTSSVNASKLALTNDLPGDGYWVTNFLREQNKPNRKAYLKKFKYKLPTTTMTDLILVDTKNCVVTKELSIRKLKEAKN